MGCHGWVALFSDPVSGAILLLLGCSTTDTALSPELPELILRLTSDLELKLLCNRRLVSVVAPYLTVPLTRVVKR